MINAQMRKKLQARDPYCVHCGSNDDLVLHHRKNRQMGGSKLLDVYENLIRVCNEYNFLMEADSAVAESARSNGHKLASWESLQSPVLDTVSGLWYVLDIKGEKSVVEPPAFLI